MEAVSFPGVVFAQQTDAQCLQWLRLAKDLQPKESENHKKNGMKTDGGANIDMI